MMNSFFIRLYDSYLIILIFVIDTIFKKWITMNFYYGEILSMTTFINLTYIKNIGIVLGFLSYDSEYFRYIFSVITIIIIIVLFYQIYFINNRSILDHFSYSIIIGGAISNLYDRFVYGGVIDFIDLHIMYWHFPIFNIADIGIFIGIHIIILNHCFNPLKK